MKTHLISMDRKQKNLNVSGSLEQREKDWRRLNKHYKKQARHLYMNTEEGETLLKKMLEHQTNKPALSS